MEVAEEFNDPINRFVGIHPLRRFDAIHLASAVLLRERLPEDFLFACFDQRTAKAAHSEGLRIFPQQKSRSGERHFLPIMAR